MYFNIDKDWRYFERGASIGKKSYMCVKSHLANAPNLVNSDHFSH
jgi:hypothetical protein